MRLAPHAAAPELRRVGTRESMAWFARFFDDPVTWCGDLQARHGDLVSLRVGPARMTVVFDPVVIERLLVADARRMHKGRAVHASRFVLGNGLLTAEDEVHRRHRRIAAPVFTPRSVGPAAPVTVDVAAQLVASWPDDGVVASARDAYDLSLRVAGITLFGSDFDARERARLHAAMEALDAGYRLVTAPGGTRAVAWGLTPRARRMRRSARHVDDVVRALVRERRHAQDVTALRDLLSLLLAARDSEDGGAFSDEELRDEAVTMLLAGHDTTAAALAWCLSALARHPHAQARVAAELHEVLDDRVPTVDDLSQLPWLRAFLDETLRLYPTGYSTAREPTEPVDVGGGGVLEPGTDVLIPFGWLSRDPRYWREPLTFRPERFLEETAADEPPRPRVAYVPFGLGPRVCIGSSFALQTLQLATACIVQSHELRLAHDGQHIDHVIGFIRRPAGDVPLRVVRRRASRVR